jgi:hypothetical protein
VSECSLLTPLRRDGTSQRQRMPEALDPCSAAVDDRSTAELLLYAGELAKLLRYYTEANEPMGDWSAFIERDVSTLAARVGAYDADAPRQNFDRLRHDAEAAGAAAFPAAYAALVAPVFGLAASFEEWRRGSIEGLRLRTRLDRLIEGVLAGALQTAVRAAKRARALGAPVTLPDFSPFDDAWGDLDPPPDLALFPSGAFGDETERRAAVKVAARAFEQIHEAARRLKAEAPRFLADTLANYPQHRPHAALFLAFLRLFNHARGAMNALTASHLDFYYRDVLQLVPRGPVADRVHVIFELAKNLPPVRVPKDTRLQAGKDATGVPRVYATDAELVVNRASLHPEHGLKTVFVDIAPGDVVRNIHAAPDADADDVAPPVDGEKRWPAFGSTALPYARVGFAVSSPMFRLAEGTREITVRFGLTSTSDVLAGRSREHVERELTHNVTVEATGPKGWIAATPRATVPPDGDPAVVYVITIGPSQPPLVAFDPGLHQEGFDTPYPVLRFVLKNEGLPGALLTDDGAPGIAEYSDDTPEYHATDVVRFEGRLYQATEDIDRPGFRPSVHTTLWNPVAYSYPYQYFQRMQVERLDLEVDVTGMRGVVLESDFGGLNPAKPFAPFGPLPRIGSSLLIGSWEIFQKSLTLLRLRLAWAGLPPGGLTAHYAGYKNGTTPIVDSDGYFTADLDLLEDGRWKPELTGLALFEELESDPPDSRVIEATFAPGEVPRDPALEPIRRFDPALTRGFVRLRLLTSFLHEMFPIALAAFAKSGDTSASPPNPPYTPMAGSFTVDYAAKETIDYATLTRAQVEDRVERLFQIAPFGHQEIAPVAPSAAVPGVAATASLVPAFHVENENAAAGTAEGTLCLGVAALVPPQNLSLLVQVAEGSEDPALPAQEVRWSYLTASGWTDFARAGILLDTTNGLIASGIVQFAVPKEATNAATVMPAGLHWLRATVRRHTGAIPKAVAVLTQAAQASFRDSGNDPRHLEAPLPAGTIAKLVEREAAIKSVSQPFSSFGGRMAEGDAGFRVRAAERLRHKRRAVTLFDYERLVLERFPDVYKVRCLVHTSGDSEYAPGAVRVVVVPNLRNRNAVDPLRPRVSLATLEEIRRDLAGMASGFADIQVVNPDYEEVRVRFNVRFGKGFDKGHYTGQLQQDIIRFLSPWLYDEGVDLTFGGRVHRSSILNFIDEREYVDFVTDFEMDHVVPATAAGPGETRVHVEEAQPTRSSAVIVPARTHEIGDAIVSCEDEAAPPAAPAPPPAGPPPLPPGAPRYLGNVHTRELHDLMHVTPYCQIDEIAIDRRFPFRRIEQAQALGYDFCAYCFGKGRSQR